MSKGSVTTSRGLEALLASIRDAASVNPSEIYALFNSIVKSGVPITERITRLTNDVYIKVNNALVKAGNASSLDGKLRTLRDQIDAIYKHETSRAGVKAAHKLMANLTLSPANAAKVKANTKARHRKNVAARRETSRAKKATATGAATVTAGAGNRKNRSNRNSSSNSNSNSGYGRPSAATGAAATGAAATGAGAAATLTAAATSHRHSQKKNVSHSRNSRHRSKSPNKKDE